MNKIIFDFLQEEPFKELSKDWNIIAYEGYWGKDPDDNEIYIPMNVYFYHKKYEKCAQIYIDDLEPTSQEQIKSIIESCLEKYNKQICKFEKYVI